MKTLDEFLDSVKQKRTLHDLFIIPDIDNASVNISFTAPQDATKADWKIFDAEGQQVCSGHIAEMSAKIEFNAEIPDCRLWNVNSPYLYSFEIIFDNDSRELVRFGMRSIKTDAATSGPGS
jgi:beta-galactosidase/beta-glucuronidase